jgi:integrase
MRLVMWFAIYSARRQSEIVSLRIEDMDEASGTYLARDLKHPDGSTGNHKHAVLPPMGWTVAKLAIGDRREGLAFPWTEDAIQRRFQDASKLLGIRDLRFHDLRHEALSRLAEDGATISQIQQVSLHESWGSLQIYVNVPAKRLRRVVFTPPAANP